MSPLLVVLLAYLIGSIPFGYVIVKLREGGDVRQTGSGGTGATNVSRRAGKAAGVLTLVLDALKGATAVLFAKVMLGGPTQSGGALNAKWWIAAAAIAAIAGHIFPVWLGFRGGKGVATGVGVFFMLAPFALLCAGIVFIAIVALTRYVSLGSIVAAAAVPVLAAAYARLGLAPPLTPATLALVVAAAATVLYRHRANLARLRAGTERRLGRGHRA